MQTRGKNVDWCLLLEQGTWEVTTCREPWESPSGKWGDSKCSLWAVGNWLKNGGGECMGGSREYGEWHLLPWLCLLPVMEQSYLWSALVWTNSLASPPPVLMFHQGKGKPVTKKLWKVTKRAFSFAYSMDATTFLHGCTTICLSLSLSFKIANSTKNVFSFSSKVNAEMQYRKYQWKTSKSFLLVDASLAQFFVPLLCFILSRFFSSDM